jgi:hypothetical protein
VAIKVLNGGLGRIGAMILDDSSGQAPSEVILFDEAFFHGAFSGKKFLFKSRAYIQVFVGKFGAEAHYFQGAEHQILGFSLFLSVLSGRPVLWLLHSLLPIIAGISVAFKSLLDEFLFEGSRLLFLIGSILSTIVLEFLVRRKLLLDGLLL